MNEGSYFHQIWNFGGMSVTGFHRFIRGFPEYLPKLSITLFLISFDIAISIQIHQNTGFITTHICHSHNPPSCQTCLPPV